MKKDDEGLYECVAQNTEGFANTSAVVTVRGESDSEHGRSYQTESLVQTEKSGLFPYFFFLRVQRHQRGPFSLVFSFHHYKLLWSDFRGEKRYPDGKLAAARNAK